MKTGIPNAGLFHLINLQYNVRLSYKRTITYHLLRIGGEVHIRYHCLTTARKPQRTPDLLNDVASCSEKLSCRIHEGEGLEFTLLKDDQRTGITFRAVPNGHEFSSLLLAVLNADGKGKTSRTKGFATG